MIRLQNLPLKRKVTLVILLTCSAVLLLACGVLAAYQLYDFRKALISDSSVLADVIGKNTCGALAFQDENSAKQTLLALQSEPYVSGARVYDAQGNEFASYVQEGAIDQLPVHPSAEGHSFQNGHLVLFHKITLNNKAIGTIYLQTDLKGMYDRLRVFGGIAFLVLAGSLLVALVLASPLQKPISGPILDLTQTVRTIAERKDYTVRVPSKGTDETGLLVDAFNQLLAGIGERDAALRGEITERKNAEGKVQSQLARLELLHRITRAISERLDLQSIFQVVIRTLEDNLPIDFICICLYEQNANILTVANVGAGGEKLAAELGMTRDARIEIDQNGLSQCVHGSLVYEPDISESQAPFPRRLAKTGLRSLVAAPLLVESKVFGALIAVRKQVESFTSGDCEFLNQLSGHVALAAHQAQLYEALQQAYDDLRQTQQAVMQQERLKALGQMASGIAHDINNAISPIALYTESLLEKETTLSPRARDYLSTIQHAIEDVSHTVARMREFYRQREQQLALTPVKLNELILQVVDLSRARWSDMPQQRGIFIKVETSLDAALPQVMGVESEIREALVNLIFNAVDAMPEGGTLTLRTRLSDQPTRLVHVEVCDTGIGMDEQTRRHCLEPFFTTKGERGTGLGLAMVFGIVRRHNADIEIESAQGKGTTMQLNFPVPATQAISASKDSAPFVVPTRLRLLVVDDDPLLIKSLRDALETDGHLVVAAGGGQDGVKAFRTSVEQKEPFAAVITDLGMPYMDGRQVAAAIKGLSPATPVILLTGWGQRLIAEGDIPPHVDHILNKPPKLRDLREILARCVQTKPA
ncbi:MAG TPA: ATP-binding protein [Verrucomicrobiae bacterium]|jgi:signal transduction histidine kinase/ActR/RegA family two-component response regulator|nr:ATP-binding protein [Verrucomicrobiae bacterium]